MASFRNIWCQSWKINRPIWRVKSWVLEHIGGFQLLDLIIPELKSHMIPYKFKSSHWLKLQHSDWRANLVKDFFLQINFPPMRTLEFVTGHVIFKLHYNQIYQLKTTFIFAFATHSTSSLAISISFVTFTFYHHLIAFTISFPFVWTRTWCRFFLTSNTSFDLLNIICKT